jgi:hypothetical protein
VIPLRWIYESCERVASTRRGGEAFVDARSSARQGFTRDVNATSSISQGAGRFYPLRASAPAAIEQFEQQSRPRKLSCSRRVSSL